MKFLEARQLVDRSAHLPAYPLRVALSGTLAPLDLYLRAHLAQHARRAELDTLPFGTLQQWLRAGQADPARDLLLLLPWDLLPALDWRTGLPADHLDEATITAALDDAERLLAPLAAQGVPLFYLPAPVPPVAATPRAQQRLEAQLDAQQDIAAQLSAELEEKAAELAEVRGGGVLAAAGWAVLGIQCTVLKLVSCRLNC